MFTDMLPPMIQTFPVVEGFESVVDQIKDYFDSFKNVFSGIDFSILYSWLPSDIAGVITTIIVALLVLAIFGLLKRVLFFLG